MIFQKATSAKPTFDGQKVPDHRSLRKALDEEFVQNCRVRSPQRSGDDPPNRCYRSTRNHCLPVDPHHRAPHSVGEHFHFIFHFPCLNFFTGIKF